MCGWPTVNSLTIWWYVIQRWACREPCENLAACEHLSLCLLCHSRSSGLKGAHWEMCSKCVHKMCSAPSHQFTRCVIRISCVMGNLFLNILNTKGFIWIFEIFYLFHAAAEQVKFLSHFCVGPMCLVKSQENFRIYLLYGTRVLVAVIVLTPEYNCPDTSVDTSQ